MSTYENWSSITPAPITCSKCGYTIQGKMGVCGLWFVVCGWW